MKLKLFVPIAICMALLPAAASAQCASGTVTAEISNDPGFENLYKYTFELTWELEQYALSHPDLFIGLENCECVCDPSIVAFGDPAGHSISEEDGEVCENDYDGEYVCMGDPSIPDDMNGPAVKWEPQEGECEPGTSGTGTFCFYSPLPPGDPMTHSNATAIKHGQEVCYGAVVGTLPICDCSVPGHHHSVGDLKARY